MTFLETLAASATAGLFSGGGIYLGLKEKLRETFQTKEEAVAQALVFGKDIDAIGGKVDGSISIAMSARERADDAHSLASETRTIQDQQWQRLTESVIEPMHRIAEELTTQGKVMAGLTEAVATLKQR